MTSNDSNCGARTDGKQDRYGRPYCACGSIANPVGFCCETGELVSVELAVNALPGTTSDPRVAARHAKKDLNAQRHLSSADLLLLGYSSDYADTYELTYSRCFNRLNKAAKRVIPFPSS